MKKHRSWLFTPGSNIKMIEKAPSTSADVIIYDLEDSVEPSFKQVARKLVKKQVQSITRSLVYSIVRVNAPNTPYYYDDIAGVVSNNLTGLMIPKAQTPDTFHELDDLLDQLEKEYNIEGGQIQLVPLIETALGVARSFEIASSSKRITRLAFGAVDYTVDIQAGITETGNELMYARGKLVNDSYAAGIQGPIDTVYTNLNNMEGFINETKAIKNMGFQGKLVIHPKQISAVNTIFTPNLVRVNEAKSIIKAYEEAREKQLGVIQLNGKMIDVPVVEHARKLVQLHEELSKEMDNKFL